MITREEFLKALDTIKMYEAQLEEQLNEVKKIKENLSPFLGVTPDTFIVETSLSVRTINVLKANSEEFTNARCEYRRCEIKVKDLEDLTLRQLMGFRNCGKSSIQEIQELCKYAGITLKTK